MIPKIIVLFSRQIPDAMLCSTPSTDNNNNNDTMNAAATESAVARFFSLAFHEGSEVNPSERMAAAEKRLAAAKAALASGHFLVASASGQMRMMDPHYFAGQFRPMRWMSEDDIASARRVPRMEVGETVMLAEGFHPRHGVKRRPMTRLA